MKNRVKEMKKTEALSEKILKEHTGFIRVTIKYSPKYHKNFCSIEHMQK